MRSPKVPEGWEYWTSEPNEEDAWRLAMAYKETHERVRSDVFVRLRVVPAKGTHWILRRIEQRQETAA
jgi:hypothetical protein